MKSTAVMVLLLLVLLLAWSATYVVNETEQVVVTMFGKPIGDPVTTPGLHFKLPYFHRVHYFDKRFLEWDGEANEDGVPTRDKRLIVVDTYARWRITDPLLFFQRLRDEPSAQSRLDDILDGATRDAIANHDLLEVVRTSNREPRRDESLAEEEQSRLEAIQLGRETIRKEILDAAQPATVDLGIEILDLRLKRINYAEAVLREVYDRMIAERKRIAARYRSEGEGEASRILGQRDRDLKEIQSDAYRQAEEIRGKADAEATDIFTAAYDRSADTRDFYEFLKSMETLESTVDPETLMILSTDGEFYRFLKDSGG
jgi:membrane protease subunit HflC